MAATALAAGCVPPPAANGIAPVAFSTIPGWQTDHLAQTLPALRAGCKRLATLPVDTALGGQGVAQSAGGLAGKWLPACNAAAALEPGDEAGIRRFYQAWFQPYRTGGAGLFTGYYEPEVAGALAQGGVYQTPILARPDDLPQPSAGRAAAYWSRAEIEAGRLGSRARPLLWLADPADLFFLQIQGSGRVRLSDGTVVRLGYDGKNGRPYTPIGRVLVEQHALSPDDVSMQSIRAWLDSHPSQAAAVMDRNEDYVFFRVLRSTDSGLGPPGALGVPLYPGRSAAVDSHAIPLGAPVFVDTVDPLTHQPWQRLLLAQDVGSDIAGAARADVFLGAGTVAAAAAGRMHEGGSMYVLLPRP